LILTPRGSRLTASWWCALHAVLASALWLVAWPWALKLGVLTALAGHAVARRPRAMPPLVIIGADATCLVPPWGLGRAPLGPRTVVCSHWIRLDLGRGPRQRDLFLFIDQLAPDQWASLRAVLERARWDAAHVMPRSREPI